MKKLSLLPLLITPVYTLGSFSLFSCNDQQPERLNDFVEPMILTKDVNSKNEKGLFAFRFKDYVCDDVKVSLFDETKQLTLPSNIVHPVGKTLDMRIDFIKELPVGTRIAFGLSFTYKLRSNKSNKITFVNDLSITYQKEGDLESWCNDYAERENKNFLNNLSMSEHDYYEEFCENFFCESGAEACVNWGHHPAWPEWSGPLHDGRGSVEALDNETTVMADFDYPGMKSYNRLVRLKDFRFLDAALNLSTVGNVGRSVYHGYEGDESDLRCFVEETSGLKMESPVDAWTDEIVKQFINKEYTDWSYLATSFDRPYSYDFCLSYKDYNTVPFLDIDVDPDVFGAYVSYSRRTWYGISLSRVENYQLLINRKAKIKVVGAEIEKCTDDYGQLKNILILKVKVSKQDPYL